MISAFRPKCRFCPKSAVYDFGIEFSAGLMPICAHCVTAMLKRIRIPNSNFAVAPSSGENVTAAGLSPLPSAAPAAVTPLSRECASRSSDITKGDRPGTELTAPRQNTLEPVRDFESSFTSTTSKDGNVHCDGITESIAASGRSESLHSSNAEPACNRGRNRDSVTGGESAAQSFSSLNSFSGIGSARETSAMLHPGAVDGSTTKLAGRDSGDRAERRSPNSSSCGGVESQTRGEVSADERSPIADGNVDSLGVAPGPQDSIPEPAKAGEASTVERALCDASGLTRASITGCCEVGRGQAPEFNSELMCVGPSSIRVLEAGRGGRTDCSPIDPIGRDPVDGAVKAWSPGLIAVTGDSSSSSGGVVSRVAPLETRAARAGVTEIGRTTAEALCRQSESRILPPLRTVGVATDPEETCSTKWPAGVPQGEPIECDGSCWDKLPPAPIATGDSNRPSDVQGLAVVGRDTVELELDSLVANLERGWLQSATFPEPVFVGIDLASGPDICVAYDPATRTFAPIDLDQNPKSISGA
jgi:hypothetical protein